MSRIVVAEDDARQATILRLYFEREGHEVIEVRNGLEAIARVTDDRPDLLVLDIMMPGADGLEVCRAVRVEHPSLPILMLTALSAEDDLLDGLELGADDYMSKPYSPRELMARVRSLLRRTQSEAVDVVAVGDLELDRRRHSVTLAGEPVELTPLEFRLLASLAASPGVVLSRSQLVEKIHGADRFIAERTVDVHVKNIRAKIEHDPAAPTRLMTVFGIGYKLVDPAP